MKYYSIYLVLFSILTFSCNNKPEINFTHQPPVDYEVYGEKIIINSASTTIEDVTIDLFYYLGTDIHDQTTLEEAMSVSGYLGTKAIYRKTAEDEKATIDWGESSGTFAGSSATGGPDFFRGMVISLFAKEHSIPQTEESLKLATHTLILEKIDFPVPLHPKWGWHEYFRE